MDYRWKVTNTGRRSPGTRVPMVAQIFQRNADVVKSMLPSAAALPSDVMNSRLFFRSPCRAQPLRAECEIGSCHLPACKTILDVVGDLFADVCQVEEFFLDDSIFGLFGKLSIRGRLLPEIVVPLHTYLPEKTKP